jgi:hypothetical protein
MDKDQEKESRKKAIFESMSLRRQEHIIKKGYESWDPFQDPKDPIDIRKDKTRHTTRELTVKFLDSVSGKKYTTEYGRGAFELCLGIIDGDEKSKGMFDFACWYSEFLHSNKK